MTRPLLFLITYADPYFIGESREVLESFFPRADFHLMVVKERGLAAFVYNRHNAALRYKFMTIAQTISYLERLDLFYLSGFCYDDFDGYTIQLPSGKTFHKSFDG